ncbi:hypothetical protein [Streptomyces profundus]|uniref:hypothetical protein n=1 Tax=Streptomyces profundus TaxID=2867410 RepID=UPI001D163706|nr:hypothetical protein [Streptomyces sp. MA3_2.13]UED85583.1 hypothetical protein K4G22_16435 [Streptomyces sp. MA3_2.13]
MKSRLSKRGSRGRHGRFLTLCVASALALTAAGCSSDDGSDEPIEGVDSGSADAGPDDADGPGAEDTAALTELYERYWAALVTLENEGELDPALFDGITTPGLAEQELLRVSGLIENGLTREGEPLISDVTVSVDGDTARVESCMNQADWPLVSEGEVVPGLLPEELTAPHPQVVTAERASGAWLIDATLLTEEATISCA